MPLIPIVETFTSIQGESSYAGMPCFFIRLAGCNLRCSYCDTRRAWTPGTDTEIAHLVQLAVNARTPLIEVTGGEPLIHPATTHLLQALAAACPGPILLETNGTIDITQTPDSTIRILDVKCPASNHPNSFLLANLTALRPHDELKFVISNRSDFDWAVDFVTRHQLTRNNRVILFSPACPALPPRELAGWILQKSLPIRLQVQLQRILDMR